MVPINYNDNLQLGNRVLHLQTQCRPQETNAVITLYEQGRVLSKEAEQIPEEVDETSLNKWILKQHQESLATLKFLFKIDRQVRSLRHFRSLMHLGDLYLRWGIIPEAVQVFDLAYKIDSNSQKALSRLSEALIQKGDTEQAISILTSALNRFESSFKQDLLLMKRGKARLILKQYEKAFEDFKRTVEQSPHCAEAHLFFALSSLESADDQMKSEETISRDSAIRLCTVHLAEALKYSTQLSRKDIEPILQNLNTNKIEPAIVQLSNIIRCLEDPMDLGVHQMFYLKFIYGNEKKNSNVVDPYIKKMEWLAKQYPKYAELNMYLGMGYVVQCRELYQKALQAFYQARNQKDEQKSYEKQFHEAEQLADSFFRFIKMLFR